MLICWSSPQLKFIGYSSSQPYMEYYVSTRCFKERYKSICLFLQLGRIPWVEIGRNFWLIPGHFKIICFIWKMVQFRDERISFSGPNTNKNIFVQEIFIRIRIWIYSYCVKHIRIYSNIQIYSNIRIYSNISIKTFLIF